MEASSDKLLLATLGFIVFISLHDYIRLHPYCLGCNVNALLCLSLSSKSSLTPTSMCFVATKTRCGSWPNSTVRTFSWFIVVLYSDS